MVPKRPVLVTGAAGRIGAYFAEHSASKYDLTLMVRPGDDVEPIRAFGQVVEADLANLEALKERFEGIDTVLHLAADPDASATWDSLLPNNVIGAYHAFVAAKAAGCRRVVYASSIHAVSGYPKDVQVKTTDPVNPGDLYGVTKCFGEALGRYMAEQEGLSVVAIRIGAFEPLEAARDPHDLSNLDGYVSHRDLHQLLELCIDAEGINFAIVHGLSDNLFKRLDLSTTRDLLGYAPVDDFVKMNPATAPLHLESVRSHGAIQDGEKSGLRTDLK